MKPLLFPALALLLLVSPLPAPAAAPDTAPAAAATPAPEPIGTGQKIALRLQRWGLPRDAVITIISALPIVELRGAVPVGHWLYGDRTRGLEGAALWKAKARVALKVLTLSVVGNMIPIPFILLFLGPISDFCMRFPSGKRFFDWLYARTRRKTAEIEKYETLGLAIFVAIPLPATGGWTGAAVAFVMGMKFNHAMVSILLGVVVAGFIMTALALLGWLGALIAGVVLIGMAVGGIARWLKKESATPA